MDVQRIPVNSPHRFPVIRVFCRRGGSPFDSRKFIFMGPLVTDLSLESSIKVFSQPLCEMVCRRFDVRAVRPCADGHDPFEGVVASCRFSSASGNTPHDIPDIRVNPLEPCASNTDRLP